MENAEKDSHRELGKVKPFRGKVKIRVGKPKIRVGKVSFPVNNNQIKLGRLKFF